MLDNIKNSVKVEQVLENSMNITVNGRKMTVSFDKLPIFKDMTIKEIFDVDFFGDDILEWKKADVHLYIDTLIHSEKYIQRFGIRPFENENQNG